MSDRPPTTQEPDTDFGIKIPRKIRGEIAWKVGVFLLLIGNLFMKTQYVSIGAYERALDVDTVDKKEIRTAIVRLEQTVSNMEVASKVNDSQDEKLRDHEDRLRGLEFKNRR